MAQAAGIGKCIASFEQDAETTGILRPHLWQSIFIKKKKGCGREERANLITYLLIRTNSRALGVRNSSKENMHFVVFSPYGCFLSLSFNLHNLIKIAK